MPLSIMTLHNATQHNDIHTNNVKFNTQHTVILTHWKMTLRIMILSLAKKFNDAQHNDIQLNNEKFNI
jgi:hypothetical protein